MGLAMGFLPEEALSAFSREELWPKGWDAVPFAHPFMSRAVADGMVLRLPYDADSPPPSP
ncbi:hypothetical protein CHLRE_12g511902v5 [Chlamydomonas reinhardtii]|uniref:Uncharacterized protein n=1 Tax=Chlamydomonas reinhardtii TaxID=3055 RepID=A0A2K3D2J7_CHLRE|nr:uncharacterized protein CHLRE_12g511902v5 [Chlamydomonas reinhardtii]PNW74745.1 hypothetical protein CHLRE_12g511902v5 [Chlamydomonas reinhardtii]